MGKQKVTGHRFALETLVYLFELVREFFVSEGVDPDKAEKAADDLTKKVADAYGGQTLYFPRDVQAQKDELHRQVVEKFDGRNQGALAAEFRLTVSTIYRILQRHRKLMRAQQPPAPPVPR